ncbi:hypothetical protein ABZ372_47510, partial [Streptomyces sp. NPDC005921]
MRFCVVRFCVVRFCGGGFCVGWLRAGWLRVVPVVATHNPASPTYTTGGFQQQYQQQPYQPQGP